MAQVLVFSFLLVLNFQSQTFAIYLICEYLVNGKRANIAVAIVYKFMYLPSNGSIVNVVHRDLLLSLYFQGYKI